MIAMNRNGYLNSVEGNYFIKEMPLALHSRLLILYFLMKNSRFTVLEGLITNSNTIRENVPICVYRNVLVKNAKKHFVFFL